MQSVNENVNNNGIHCKVATPDAVRRFYAKNTDYDALLEQICAIFGFPKDSVVIKYMDDENDLVTISSDQELKFAIDLSPRVLKLKVEVVSKPSDCAIPAACVDAPRMCNKKWRKYAEKDQKRCEKWSEHCSKRSDKYAEKYQKKSEKWAEKKAKRREKWADSCEDKKKLSKPERIQEKLSHLRNKQAKLQAKLSALESTPDAPAASLEKARTKLAVFSAKVAWFEQLARDLPPSTEGTSCDANVCATPFSEISESESDEKKEERQKFEERVTSLRLALRQAQLQHQLLRTNFQAFVSQQPAQPGESFHESVKQLKANLDASKRELCQKRKELHQLLGQLGEAQCEMRKACGKKKWCRSLEEPVDDDETGLLQDDEAPFRPWHGRHQGRHHGHHGHHGHRGPGHHGPHHGPYPGPEGFPGSFPGPLGFPGPYAGPYGYPGCPHAQGPAGGFPHQPRDESQ